MNPVEIGREFEQKAFDYLQTQFDEVRWLSKENWHSPYDFLCKKGNIEFKVEAKKNKGGCKRDIEVDYFVTTIKEEIKLIRPSDLKGSPPKRNHMKLQIDLVENTNKMLKIYKAINGLATLEEAAIAVLNKYLTDEIPETLINANEDTE